MTIHQADNHEAMSREAAQRILAALTVKPGMLLCAAGGTTPLRTYDLLAEHGAKNAESFRSLRLVKLDEWGGLPTGSPGTCEAQLREHLLDPLSLSNDRYLGFSSDATNAPAECERVRERLAAEGPIDVCVLGLGMNGHVAMNEPAAAVRPYCHVAKLAETSLGHIMLTASKVAPTYGLTLGMTEILASREILLLVSGAAKREPLRRLLSRQITTEFPASFLWLHSNWTLLCDRAAAGQIQDDELL